MSGGEERLVARVGTRAANGAGLGAAKNCNLSTYPEGFSKFNINLRQFPRKRTGRSQVEACAREKEKKEEKDE